jgi:tetratricopeptide (TPR) repeat protein
MRFFARRRRRRIGIALAIIVLLASGTAWILHGVRLPDATNPPRPDTPEELAELQHVAALLDEAQKRSLAHDADGTLQLLDEVVARRPDDALMRSVHGDAFVSLNRYAEALAAYRQAVSLQPDNFDHRVDVAMTLARMGDLAAAQGELDTILREQPDFAVALLQRAALLLAMGDLDQARHALDAAIAEMGDTIIRRLSATELLLCRGSLRVLVSEDAAGLEDLARVGRLNPTRAEPHLAMMIAQQHLGRTFAWPIEAVPGDDEDPLLMDIMNIYRHGAAPELPLRRIADHRYAWRRNDLTIAHYYLAEWFVMEGDLAAAREHFQAVLDKGLPYYCAYGLAKLRLAAIGP